MPALRNGDLLPHPSPVTTFSAPNEAAVPVEVLVLLNCQKLYATSPSMTISSPSVPAAPFAAAGM